MICNEIVPFIIHFISNLYHLILLPSYNLVRQTTNSLFVKSVFNSNWTLCCFEFLEVIYVAYRYVLNVIILVTIFINTKVMYIYYMFNTKLEFLVKI